MEQQKQEGYGLVYRTVMRRRDLTAEAKAIYAYLCSFAGSGTTCYPSVELMCAELGMGEERFGKHMALLIKARIVQKERQRVGNRLGKNLYTLTHSPDFLPPENKGIETPLSPDFQGLENQSLEFPGLENRGPNSNSFSITSSDITSTNDIASFAEKIRCQLYDNCKTARHNGRPRSDPVYAVRRILEMGASEEDIVKAAERAAVLDWVDLEKGALAECKLRRHKEAQASTAKPTSSKNELVELLLPEYLRGR